MKYKIYIILGILVFSIIIFQKIIYGDMDLFASESEPIALQSDNILINKNIELPIHFYIPQKGKYYFKMECDDVIYTVKDFELYYKGLKKNFVNDIKCYFIKKCIYETGDMGYGAYIIYKNFNSNSYIFEQKDYKIQFNLKYDDYKKSNNKCIIKLLTFTNKTINTKEITITKVEN
jgi:hypothetical protein